MDAIGGWLYDFSSGRYFSLIPGLGVKLSKRHCLCRALSLRGRTVRGDAGGKPYNGGTAPARYEANSPSPSSPAGTSFPPFSRISAFSLLGSNLLLDQFELGP